MTTLLDGLRSVYARLLACQRDLPVEAARILRTHLWDLYD